MSEGEASRARSVTIFDADDSLRAVQDEMLRAAESAGYAESSRFALRLALEEAVVNAFRHGNGGDASVGVDVSYEVDGERVVVTVEDRGTGFDPATVPDPTEEERLTVPSGRGLLLMRAYMTRVRHNERGNRVEMVYEKGRGGEVRPSSGGG